MRRLTAQPSSTVEEARAALEGVKMAAEKGWTEIVLEGDNSRIVSAIQNREHDTLLPYGALISVLLSISISFQDFSCSFIRRTGNMLAHSLAHFPLDFLDMMEAFDLPAGLATVI